MMERFFYKCLICERRKFFSGSCAVKIGNIHNNDTITKYVCIPCADETFVGDDVLYEIEDAIHGKKE